jgi:hypothetical protein
MSFEVFIAISLVFFWALLPASVAIAMTQFDDALLDHHDEEHH